MSALRAIFVSLAIAVTVAMVFGFLGLYADISRGNGIPGKQGIIGAIGPRGNTGSCNLSDPNQLFIVGNLTILGELDANGTSNFNNNVTLFDKCKFYISNNNTNESDSSCLVLDCNLNPNQTDSPLCISLGSGGLSLLDNNLPFYFNNISFNGDNIDFSNTTLTMKIIQGNVSFNGIFDLPLLLGKNSQTIIREDPIDNTFIQFLDPQGIRFTIGLFIIEGDIITEGYQFLNTIDIPFGLKIEQNTIKICPSNNSGELCILGNNLLKLDSPLIIIGNNKSEKIQIAGIVTDIVNFDSTGELNFNNTGIIGIDNNNHLLISRNTSLVGSSVLILDNLIIQNGFISFINKNISFDANTFISSNVHITTGNLLLDQNITVSGTANINDLNINGNLSISNYLFTKNINNTNRIYTDFLGVKSLLESDGTIQANGNVFFNPSSAVLFSGLNFLGSPLFCNNIFIQPDTPLTPNANPCILECPEQIRCITRFRSVTVFDTFTVGGLLPSNYNLTYTQSLNVNLGTTLTLLNTLSISAQTESRHINGSSTESGTSITSYWLTSNIRAVTSIDLTAPGTGGNGFVGEPGGCTISNNASINTCNSVKYYYNWINETTFATRGEVLYGAASIVKQCDPLTPLCYPFSYRVIPIIDYITLLRTETKNTTSSVVFDSFFPNASSIVTQTNFSINSNNKYSYLYQNGPNGYGEFDFGQFLIMGKGLLNTTNSLPPNVNDNSTTNETYIVINKMENYINLHANKVYVTGFNGSSQQGMGPLIVGGDILQDDFTIHRCCTGTQFTNRRAYYYLDPSQTSCSNQDTLRYSLPYPSIDPGGSFSNIMPAGVLNIPSDGSYTFDLTLTYGVLGGDNSTFRGCTMVVTGCASLTSNYNDGFIYAIPFSGNNIKVHCKYTMYLLSTCVVRFKSWLDGINIPIVNSTPPENKLEIFVN